MSDFDLIVVRNRVVEAERIYVSGRGDYTVYLYHGKEYTTRTPAPFPHPGACAKCRKEKRCNFCGLLFADRCTNGRCLDCHNRHCTPGGATDDGHGFGSQGTGPHFA